MTTIYVPGEFKEEAKYERMVELGTQLGLPVPQMFLKLESVDAKGDVVDMYEGRSRTWVRNFWNIVFEKFCLPSAASANFGAGYLGVKGYTGTVSGLGGWGTRSNNGSVPDFQVFTAAANANNQGIVVGTGTTAESFESYSLAAVVASGTASGQLTYSAGTKSTPTYDSPSRTWTCTASRTFTNSFNGTGPIITETGMYSPSVAGSSTILMLARDLLASSVQVVYGGVLTVTYTITLTFPA